MGDIAWPVYTIGERSLLPLGTLAGGAIAQAIGVRQALLIAALGTGA